MNGQRQIVGIMLLRNEEWTAPWALENVREFCDHIYIFDNGSTDATASLMRQAAQEDAGITWQSIAHPRESHLCLEPLAGTPTWVFAVDGDEIYDPAALRALRPRILAGEFDQHFKLTANCLHVESVDAARQTVTGYTCPPAKAVTKLYHFNAIEYWRNVPNERLHDGEVKFRAGYHDDARLHFWQEFDWEETPMRCLHLCFMSRSAQDDPKVTARANISDVAAAEKKRRWWQRCWKKTHPPSQPSAWKEDQYRKGECMEKSLTPFLSAGAEVFLQQTQSG